MNIKRSDFIEFFKRTAHIKNAGKNIVSALDYIKLTVKDGVGSLEDTNLNISCRYTFSADGEICVLLDRKTIRALVSNTLSEHIEISFTEEKVKKETIITVTLKSDKAVQSFQSSAIENYPKFITPEKGEVFTIGEDIIEAIRIASNHTASKSGDFSGYVWSTDNDIFSSDYFSMYHRKFERLPAMALPLEACNTIALFHEVDLYQSENHLFVESGNTMYALRNPEVNAPKYVSHITSVDRTAGFTFNKCDLEVFCNLTQAMTVSDVNKVSLSDEGQAELSLSFEDHGFAISNKGTLPYEKGAEDTGSMIFVLGQLHNVIRSIPYQKLRMSNQGKRVHIISEEDPTYTGVLMQAVYQ